jgi:plasmid stabilization system protein ParE
VKKVSVQRLAEQDVFDAIDYYAENAPRVVERFLGAFDRTLLTIRRAPGIGSLAFAETLDIAGLRYQTLKSFPYAVFYQELDSEIRVLRVLHHGRDVMSLIGAADY